jgi:membrane-bound ClpP family serine protease
METNRPEKGRFIVGIVLLVAGLALVVAAVLLVLFAHIGAAAAAIGVPGIALIATSRLTVAERQKPA